MDDPKSLVPSNLPIVSDAPKPPVPNPISPPTSVSPPLSNPLPKPVSPAVPSSASLPPKTSIAPTSPVTPPSAPPPATSSSPVVSGLHATSNPVKSPSGDHGAGQQPTAITLPHSSIRTMESDIKSAQSGQAPKSIELKPPVLPPEPVKPAVPALSPKPAAPAATPSAGVKLGEGEAEKRTASLPGQIIPKPAPPPTVPPIKPASPPASVTIPPKLSIFANKKILAGLAIVALAALGGILYFYLGREETEVIQPTLTPSISLTPSSVPISKLSLSNLLGEIKNISIPTTGELFESLDIIGVNVSNSAQNKNILVALVDETKNNYKFSNFLERFSISFPINLTSSVDNDDFALILTKQTEFFDESGKMIASPSAEMLITPKIALAVRVVDSTEAKTQLNLWEDTMAQDFDDFYGLEGVNPYPLDVRLSDSFYRGVKIRYANFSYANQAIDYAIITAKNGNDYLIIANSREQVYSIIDKLLGF